MLALLLTHVFCILLAGGLRFGPDAVLPGTGTPLWVATCAATGLASAALLLRERRAGRAPWHSRGRLLLWMVFPGAAVLDWALGAEPEFEQVHTLSLAVLLGLVIGALSRRTPEWAGRENRAAAWAIAARWLLVPTALVAAAGIRTGGAPILEPVALFTYPVYAAAQLAAMLILPWTQFARDGAAPAGRIAVLASLFGLVHWPNPFAAIASAAGMVLWAAAWRAGSAFVPLALSMGLMATALTQGLPDELTGHMRVGAGYVVRDRADARKEAIEERAAALVAHAGWNGEGDLRGWLRRILLEFEPEAAVEGVIDPTAEILERLHRENTVRWIFRSDEFRHRNGIERELDDDELSFFESTFVPFHPAHAPYAELVSQGASLEHEEFLDLVYRTLLGRPIGERELLHWPAPLSPHARLLFARRLVAAGEIRRWNEPWADEARSRIRARREATSR